MRFGLPVLAALAALLAACAAPAAAPDADQGRDMAIPALEPVDLAAGEKLRVVATTGIVGDVAAQVGGDLIDLTVLIDPGVDPHSYQPVAADLALAEDAHVLLVNGLHLEEGLLATLESVGGTVPLVPVSAGVEVLAGGEHGEGDPHTWMDPANVMIWADNIAAAFSALHPAHAADYQANAAAYRVQLEALDAYIREQAARIPQANRKLVTNHEAFGYFAARYGFEVVGTVYLGASQLAEPSAGDMARLVETIRAEGVRAIFIETTVNDALARTISAEIGTPIGVYTLYTGSLGAPGSGADSYTGMMRANIDTIVAALGS
jgi:ABC-type Zn uptake system ZnuABC Zn-binding protein ZnuA